MGKEKDEEEEEEVEGEKDEEEKEKEGESRRRKMERLLELGGLSDQMGSFGVGADYHCCHISLLMEY